MPRTRQLAAIMFTDIAGYTALMQQHEKKAIETREKHRRIFNSSTQKYDGRILQYYGDGTLSIFNSAIAAVKCAIEMQKAFLKEPAIPVRIGIHSGDIIVSDEEIIGDSVNIASRIESLAVPGSIFISDKVHDEIKNQESIRSNRLKTVKLKNVERPVELYAISNAGLVVPAPADIIDEKRTLRIHETGAQKQSESEHREHAPRTSILSTKLYMPPARSEVIHRTRLIEKLNHGLHRRLTLISAPAGFGKTTVVSDWIAGCERPAAWLSLDQADSEFTRFLDYLIASLRTISEKAGIGTLDLLRSPQRPSAEAIMANLLNDVSKTFESLSFIM